tara:strand:+ start:1441 stop:1611 length:171 start_codon:yes stop_codon:yes gene_type:complete
MEDEKEIVEIKHKIDAEFIIGLYRKASKEKGKKRQDILDKTAILKNHIGKYIALKN